MTAYQMKYRIVDSRIFKAFRNDCSRFGMTVNACDHDLILLAVY